MACCALDILSLASNMNTTLCFCQNFCARMANYGFEDDAPYEGDEDGLMNEEQFDASFGGITVDNVNFSFFNKEAEILPVLEILSPLVNRPQFDSHAAAGFVA